MTDLALQLKKLTTRSTKPEYLRRLHAAANVIAAYLTLTDDDRQQFEQFLALQVYGDPETNSYLHLACTKYVADSERVMHTYEHFAIYNAWSTWDCELKKSHLAHKHQREAIKDLLGALIQLECPGSSLPELELYKAAEKTMFWAGLDEVYLLQLHNAGMTSETYNAKLAALALAKHLDDGDSLGCKVRSYNL
jgi:hypothetical protein